MIRAQEVIWLPLGSHVDLVAADIGLAEGVLALTGLTGDVGAVLSVTERQAPTEQDFAAKQDQVRDSLLQTRQNEAFALFLGNLRETMEKSGKVKINQKELAALTKAKTEESE